MDAFHAECTHFASKRDTPDPSDNSLRKLGRHEILELACVLPLSPPMKPRRKLRTAGDAARAWLRVEVLGDYTICSQARAYAEYRVFAALTQITDTEKVRHARVVLRSVSGEGSRDRVACTVTVALDGSNHLRVSGR